ncbi:MAG TPA: SdpI family protein [Candidatus Mediterraneibacter tabaqchaliae]|uniref:SdpI family protein n=1 Tax=Candidatus Mediterraneibacter tabaqchaliae TaxID=2838689 RepID=A0A9D2U307_9FIRM|nr:SdpI family protein [Candidatus Mediterraneibacter tabaqchaliae]
MKKYKKMIIITTLVTLLPILLGIILWEKLPDSIATHWGADGQANGWSNKAFAVFGMPCILAAIHLFSVCVTLNDPKRKNIHKKPLALVFWIVPVVSLVTSGFTYMAALGSDIDIRLIVSIMMGILFIILGNYMPKLQQNYTVGIKLPWTLNSVENWNRTHRFGGKLFIAGGVLTAVSGILSPLLGETSWIVIVLTITIACAVVPMGYSFWLFKKGV